MTYRCIICNYHRELKGGYLDYYPADCNVQVNTGLCDVCDQEHQKAMFYDVQEYLQEGEVSNIDDEFINQESITLSKSKLLIE